jgi:hypothetical protein
MHHLWMAFADNPTGQHLAKDGDLRGHTPRQAFDDARQTGALNGRGVYWMLLVDPDTADRDVVAGYGDNCPRSIPGEFSFHCRQDVPFYPSVRPTKQ